MIVERASLVSSTLIVMVVLGTTTHEFASDYLVRPLRNSWMVVPSPTMT
jgi:hypothetical protein